MVTNYFIILARISTLINNFTWELVTKLLWQRSVCLGSYSTRHKPLKQTPAPFLPKCWATRILEHWDDCNTQINFWGRRKSHKCFKICDEYCSLRMQPSMLIYDTWSHLYLILHKYKVVRNCFKSPIFLSVIEINLPVVADRSLEGGFSYYPACPQRCVQRCHYST